MSDRCPIMLLVLDHMQNYGPGAYGPGAYGPGEYGMVLDHIWWPDLTLQMWVIYITSLQWL